MLDCSKVADLIYDQLPDDIRVPIEGTNLFLINKDHIEQLTDDLHFTIALVISDILNAGSEKDAVMENEQLADAIADELKGWSNHPDNEPDPEARMCTDPDWMTP